ncbi:folylpolyglutamate synthase/dihydrofolate synthase family protein [Microbacterium sp. ARD32]|uniref:bifunctional folylpolyglutamate synthase/dihydrofolate synthase n=1 Tax=Microbacterium sp. ARD32 TaxID=2962577 RepID=UPI0028825080|nr:folylpolyglutamate synthase/dihydrofolate synthase family protein [Microbacterium sp. ARD32]MDT0157444.1 folylpolyglutamate synthase/dihydrofolate synthase family protein [Microbacterium sp. ARD32]
MSDVQRADIVYEKLLERAGERWVQPRKERVARILTLLDDPQRTYRVVHLTGTNGKTSTARMIESLLRAHGLRTGLFTSPHLKRFTERIMIDGEPIADAAVADAWDEIEPFIAIVDAELEAAGDAALTFFELLTVLAFVAAADAPVDVLVLEVGMGGSWDSTNTADGDVAVFAPIAMDHADRLGDTVEKIAEVKAGIIKHGAAVVSAEQRPEVAAVLRRVAAENDARIAFEGEDFGLKAQALAVGGQLISIHGLAGDYDDEYLPLYGAHQGHNAALAVVAVESLIGGATQRIAGGVITEGLQNATSPGRLQLVGIAPTVVVDAAHNPHGAESLARALDDSFDFDEWGLVLGVFADKDAAGIIDRLLPAVTEVFATSPDSSRAAEADDIADLVEGRGRRASVHPTLADAADAAREWAAASERRAVVIAGSIVLAGEALLLSEEEDWKSGWRA